MIWVIAIVVCLFVLVLAGILWMALSKPAARIEARKEKRVRTEALYQKFDWNH